MRKSAASTDADHEPIESRRHDLEHRLVAAMAEQMARYGDYEWTERETDLIDAAGAEVDAAVQAGDRAAFDEAIEVWMRRTTPIEVLVDQIGGGGDEGRDSYPTREHVQRWTATYREAVDREMAPARLIVSKCSRLGGRDLVLIAETNGAAAADASPRDPGEPAPMEFPLGDLPILMEVAETTATTNSAAPALPYELAGFIRATRRAFGDGVELVGFVPEVVSRGAGGVPLTGPPGSEYPADWRDLGEEIIRIII